MKPKGTKKPLILCIDDEELILQTTADYLEEAGYRVITAINGKEGLSLFRDYFPDAVLLDLRMPEMDGFEVLKIFTEEFPETPVIIMSGAGRVQDVIAAQRTGAWDYLNKPVVEMELITQTLERSFSRARLMRENREYAAYLKVLVAERTQELEKANRELEEEVAERKHSEEELRRAMEQVKLASRVKEQFLARMSHEIRTPLNAVIGMVNLAFMTDDDSERLDYLITVRESADHLMGIINDILDFSKIEEGKLVLEKIHFDFIRFLNDIIRTMSIRAGEKSLYLELVAEENLPDAIKSDPTRLRQILINLISNALKFTSRGGVIIRVGLDAEQDLKEKDLLSLNFSIDDTGIGIPPDRIDSIFDSFTQSDDSISRKYGGTGLGLAICRQLVTKMGGVIGVESHPGNGSTFFFSIPVEVPHNGRVEVPGEEVREIRKGESYRILMAEDNEINQKLNATVLLKLGHEVTVAKNGLYVLEEMSKNDFDLILMDIEMPHMNGLEATEAIRKGEAGEDKKDIPIIAMTAHVQDEIKRQCFEVGMNDYVGKPIKIELLGNRLEEVMRKAEALTVQSEEKTAIFNKSEGLP